MMRDPFAGLRIIEFMLRVCFILILAISGWQDVRTRRIEVRVFVISGAVGIMLRGVQIAIMLHTLQDIKNSVWIWEMSARGLIDIGKGMCLGGLLLILSAVTREAVGKGDGWFFVVSGLYLGFAKNLYLLCGGLLLCFLICFVIWIKGIRGGSNKGKMRLPFLPFIIPAGIGVILF